MVVPRWALACHVAVLGGPRQRHAAVERFHQGALDLLPRCLVAWIAVTALLRQSLAARLYLGVLDQQAHFAAIEVDAQAVAVLEQRQAAAGGRLGRGIQDRGRAGGARLATVAQARQRFDAALDQP